DRDMSNGSSIGFTSFGGESGCVLDQSSETEQREEKGEARSTKEPVQADIWYRNILYIQIMGHLCLHLLQLLSISSGKWKQNAGNLSGKCAEKLSRMIWEEKHEHDGPWQNLNADNAYHIGAFLDVPIVQELNSTGPLVWPSITVDGVTRLKEYTKLTPAEAIQADCDIKAINIILQGLPTEIYALFLNTLPDEWSKFVTDVKLVKDLHTTNVDHLHAYLEQHERHANEVRLMHEHNSDPLALVASHQITQSPYQTHQHTYQNTQLQPPASTYPSSQYGSPYQSQQYSTHQSSTPLLVTYPSNDFQSSIHHNIYSPSSSIPQLEYPPQINQQSEFSQQDSVVTSRYPTTNNQLRNSSNPRQQATINNGRVTLQPIQGRQTSFVVGTSRTYTPGASGSNSEKQRTVICYNCKGEGQCQNRASLMSRLDKFVSGDDTISSVVRFRVQADVVDANSRIPQNPQLSIRTSNVEKGTHPQLFTEGVKQSTSASGSQPSGNTKKDKIQQTQSRILKNKHSKLNANSELKCVKCNGCMLSDNHDLCVLDFINNMNARAKSRFVKKNSKRKVWKPTGKVFTNIGYIWRPTGRTFTIVGNACPLTRITTTTEVPLRKSSALDNKTPKPVVTLVYSRKPRKSKTSVPVNNYKVIKSVTANNSEPSQSRGSIVSNVPSSSLDECRSSKLSSGKSTKKPHKPKSEDTNQEKLYLLHMDLCGPMRVASVNGKKTDNGTEFVNHTFREYYEKVDISHETSVACSPQQNGIVERRNCMLIEAARTMLIYAKAPLFLWAEAVATACYTKNHSMIRRRHGKTPYELLHNKPP
ncbi:retrovirus-related pol polyprotein from transposon TNT 1-94, partial [Tanacetum coccineum]